MPQGNVGQVEQRRPVGPARVHDLKDGLQIPVQVYDRTDLPLECEGIISPIPPTMRYPAGQVHGLAGPGVDAPAADLRRQGAGGNRAFLILEMVNVQRGAAAMRGQGPPQLEDDFPGLLLPPKVEDLAGVAILQSEIAYRGESHGGS